MKISKNVMICLPRVFVSPFFIVTEVFSTYLNLVGVGIQGLVASISNMMILDVELVDDTTVYMLVEEGNLCKAKAALETFCVASGAKVNWCKLVAFWVSMRSLPSWRPFESFHWIHGVSIRYLGCQVGIIMHKERFLAHRMLSLRKKLLIWDTIELSLVVRVIIAN